MLAILCLCVQQMGEFTNVSNLFLCSTPSKHPATKNWIWQEINPYCDLIIAGIMGKM